MQRVRQLAHRPSGLELRVRALALATEVELLEPFRPRVSFFPMRSLEAADWFLRSG